MRRDDVEITEDQKKNMIERRLSEYTAKIFSFEMDRTALVAIGDEEGIKTTDERIESLRKAYEAVEGMM